MAPHAATVSQLRAASGAYRAMICSWPRVGTVRSALLAVVVAAGCHPPPAHTPVAHHVKLAVLPAESAAFPRAAKAATDALLGARVDADRQLSKVSLEVVQLSIECVDATPACLQAAGKSLAADELLFAQLAAEPKKHVRLTVTRFDVAAGRVRGTANKVFASEGEASAGAVRLVEEATR